MLGGVPTKGGALRGRVGTGFTDDERRRLDTTLEERSDSPSTAIRSRRAVPFSCIPDASRRSSSRVDVGWLLRHPSYKGLREEAPPRLPRRRQARPRRGEVRAAGRTLKVTNLDRSSIRRRAHQREGSIIRRDAPGDLPPSGRPTRVRFPDGWKAELLREAVPETPARRFVTARCPVEKVVDSASPTTCDVGGWPTRRVELPRRCTAPRPLDPRHEGLRHRPGRRRRSSSGCRVGLWLRGWSRTGIQAFRDLRSKGMQVYVPLNVPSALAQPKGSQGVAEMWRPPNPSRRVAEDEVGRTGKCSSTGPERRAQTTLRVLAARPRATDGVDSVTWAGGACMLDGGDPQQIVFETAQCSNASASRGPVREVLSLVQDIHALGTPKKLRKSA